MLGREPTAIPFSAEAMRASLLRLQNEWETVQASRDRDAIYGYLTAVFELVAGWTRRVGQSSVLIGPCTCEGILGQTARTVRGRNLLYGRS